jgi:hypothetical protein
MLAHVQDLELLPLILSAAAVAAAAAAVPAIQEAAVDILVNILQRARGNLIFY